MKMSIPTTDNFVSTHYGRSSALTIADIKAGKIASIEKFSIQGLPRESVPLLLHDKGVARFICNSIGSQAKTLMENCNIQVIAGISGSIDAVLDSVINGTLIANGESACVPGTGNKTNKV
jgi:predicted Fe-Mo cluster-binding NifX family protein